MGENGCLQLKVPNGSSGWTVACFLLISSQLIAATENEPSLNDELSDTTQQASPSSEKRSIEAILNEIPNFHSLQLLSQLSGSVPTPPGFGDYGDFLPPFSHELLGSTNYHGRNSSSHSEQPYDPYSSNDDYPDFPSIPFPIYPPLLESDRESQSQLINLPKVNHDTTLYSSGKTSRPRHRGYPNRSYLPKGKKLYHHHRFQASEPDSTTSPFYPSHGPLTSSSPVHSLRLPIIHRYSQTRPRDYYRKLAQTSALPEGHPINLLFDKIEDSQEQPDYSWKEWQQRYRWPTDSASSASPNKLKSLFESYSVDNQLSSVPVRSLYGEVPSPYLDHSSESAAAGASDFTEYRQHRYGLDYANSAREVNTGQPTSSSDDNNIESDVSLLDQQELLATSLLYQHQPHHHTLTSSVSLGHSTPSPLLNLQESHYGAPVGYSSGIQSLQGVSATVNPLDVLSASSSSSNSINNAIIGLGTSSSLYPTSIYDALAAYPATSSPNILSPASSMF